MGNLKEKMAKFKKVLDYLSVIAVVWTLAGTVPLFLYGYGLIELTGLAFVFLLFCVYLSVYLYLLLNGKEITGYPIDLEKYSGFKRKYYWVNWIFTMVSIIGLLLLFGGLILYLLWSIGTLLIIGVIAWLAIIPVALVLGIYFLIRGKEIVVADIRRVLPILAFVAILTFVNQLIAHISDFVVILGVIIFIVIILVLKHFYRKKSLEVRS